MSNRRKSRNHGNRAKNSNIWIIVGLLACIAVVLILPRLISDPGEGERRLIDQLPEAKGYVRITSADRVQWFPLPETDGTNYEISRATTGGMMTNVVRVTPEGVFVESANCDNQDCVEQGMVTLENRETRALANMIICLPHEMSVELYSAEEIANVQPGATEIPAAE